MQSVFLKEDQMSGFLTTHVLDTARGIPAEGVNITLYRLLGSARTQLASMITNKDGCTNNPILLKDAFSEGTYELVFDVGFLFKAELVTDNDAPLFLGFRPHSFWR